MRHRKSHRTMPSVSGPTATVTNFFDEGSPFLSHPQLTAERTAREVDFVESALGLLPPARVLDIGCGFGRHSIELARRAYQVVGIDPSPAMIAAARRNAAEANVAIEFQIQRGEDFVTDEPFAAAICLFTTLGQIKSSSDNRRILSGIYAALQPGGLLLVEVPQREPAVHALCTQDSFGDQHHYTKIYRAYDPLDNTIHETFLLVSPTGRSTFVLQYRLYSRSELTALLQDAGFYIRAAYGDYHGTPLTGEHLQMLLVGEKR